MTLSVRRSLRSVLGRAYRFALGPSDPTVLGELHRRELARWTMFTRAADFVNFEAVEGDFLEFGVFGGVSLALLADAYRCDPKGVDRRIVGFDSFGGLPTSEESHDRWDAGDCARMHGWHPFLDVGDPVSPDTTLELFRRCELPPPKLEHGLFEKTLPAAIPSKYAAAAVVHIDCDLYESTRVVLEGIAPILQEGTLVLFDEWFSHKGNPNRGESRAFGEFLEEHPEWGARHYRAYGSFSDSFILYRQ